MERLAKEDRAYQRDLKKQEIEILQLQLQVRSQVDRESKPNVTNTMKARAPKLPFFEEQFH